MDNIIPPVATATIIETPERTNGKRKHNDDLETESSVFMITSLLEIIKSNHELMSTRKIDYNNSNSIVRDLTKVLFTQITVLQKEEGIAYCGENYERSGFIEEHIENLENNNIYTNLYKIYRAAGYQLDNNNKLYIKCLLPTDIPLDCVVNLCMEKVFPTDYSNITAIAKNEPKEKEEMVNEEMEKLCEDTMKQDYSFDDFVDDMFDQCAKH